MLRARASSSSSAAATLEALFGRAEVLTTTMTTTSIANDGVDVFVRGVLLLFSFQSVAICALGIEGRMSSLD